MTPDPSAPPAPTTEPRPRWPWVALALAMAWAALVRVPAVLNAEAHLDSDLAVDGLVLADAVRGHWRWHYPGTPYIGGPPVLLSWPQAMIWGPNAVALVSGGVVAYELVILATFLLGRRAFGPRAAAWALVPLAFGSTGLIWLSLRITGGHLLTSACFAATLAVMHSFLTFGGKLRAFGLGVWCGLGLYLDQMFLFALVAVVPSALIGGWVLAGPRRGTAWALLLGLGFALGDLPREWGAYLDPYSAYGEQFDPILHRDPSGQLDWPRARKLAVAHLRLLALECLPRLVAGPLLPDFRSDPVTEPHTGRVLGAGPPRARVPAPAVSVAVVLIALPLFAAGLVALLRPPADPYDLAGLAVRWGLLTAGAGVCAGFVLNQQIFNSDNYRYLVLLIPAWSLGFGLVMSGLARKGALGAVAAAGLAAALAATTTLDTARWYAGLGWLDDRGRPARVVVRDPALDWLRAHPEVDRFFGGYWDVYRLSFLTGGRVRGVPYRDYPDRFPEWRRGLPQGRPRLLLARPRDRGAFYIAVALQQGGRDLFRSRDLRVIDWPWGS